MERFINDNNFLQPQHHGLRTSSQYQTGFYRNCLLREHPVLYLHLCRITSSSQNVSTRLDLHQAITSNPKTRNSQPQNPVDIKLNKLHTTLTIWPRQVQSRFEMVRVEALNFNVLPLDPSLSFCSRFSFVLYSFSSTLISGDYKKLIVVEQAVNNISVARQHDQGHRWLRLWGSAPVSFSH